METGYALIVLAGLPEPQVNMIVHIGAEGRGSFDLCYRIQVDLEYDGRQPAYTRAVESRSERREG